MQQKVYGFILLRQVMNYTIYSYEIFPVSQIWTMSMGHAHGVDRIHPSPAPLKMVIAANFR